MADARALLCGRLGWPLGAVCAGRPIIVVVADMLQHVVERAVEMALGREVE